MWRRSWAVTGPTMVYKVSEDLFHTQRYKLGCLGAISHMVQMCNVIQPVLVSQHPPGRLSLTFFRKGNCFILYLFLNQLHWNWDVAFFKQILSRLDILIASRNAAFISPILLRSEVLIASLLRFCNKEVHRLTGLDCIYRGKVMFAPTVDIHIYLHWRTPVKYISTQMNNNNNKKIIL